MIMSLGQIHINDGILRYPIDKLTNISLDWFLEDSQETIAFYDQKRKGVLKYVAQVMIGFWSARFPNNLIWASLEGKHPRHQRYTGNIRTPWFY